MLYDNAQLLTLYAKAYKVFKKPLYKRVLYKTSEFLSNYLQNGNSGYFSSTAADTEGEEGKYYKWTSTEIDSILGSDAKWFKQFANITKGKEWKENYFLLYPDKNIKILNDKKLNTQFETCKQKLEAYKHKNRVKPSVDNKIITSWNAMLLSGFIDAYLSTNDKYFLQKATNLAKFLSENIRNNEIKHIVNYKSESYLEDYAFLAEAFIKMYQLTNDENYLNKANSLTKKAIEIFFYKEKNIFRNSENNKLIENDYINLKDDVIPSANSIMLENIHKLSIILSCENYTNLYKVISNSYRNIIKQNKFEYTNWKRVLNSSKNPFYHIVIIGKKAEKFYKKLSLFHFPNTLIIWSNNKNTNLEIFKHRFSEKTTNIYICTENACLQTKTNIDEVILLLKENTNYTSLNHKLRFP